MGIKNYHQWLKQKYAKIFIQMKDHNVYEYIYIDVNNVLHNAACESKTDEDFMDRLMYQFNVVFSNFIATKAIFFAIDGSSPFAKILVQKERRDSMGKKWDTNKFNPLYFTPGTTSMQKIEQGIQLYIEYLSKQYKFLKPKFEISSSKNPGEGEIKIIKKIIQNSNNLKDRHLIIGNDADIIVISMSLIPIYNICVSFRNNDGHYLMSLKKLIKYHAISINKYTNMKKMIHSNMRKDFVILSILMGNDYLPKLSHANYKKLFDIYIQTIQYSDYLVNDNNTFNHSSLTKFLPALHSQLSTKKIKFFEYDADVTKSYFGGLLWCLNMYSTGICSKYDYYYKGTGCIHPFHILYYFFSGQPIELPVSNIQPLPNFLCAILLLPKNSVHLIPNKYKFLINKMDFIYQDECQECIEIKKQFSNIAKQIYQCRKNNINHDDLKKDYSNTMAKFKIHKQKHNSSNFSFDDVYRVIDIFNSISQS